MIPNGSSGEAAALYFDLVDDDDGSFETAHTFNDVGGGLTDEFLLLLPGESSYANTEIARIVQRGNGYRYLLNADETDVDGVIEWYPNVSGFGQTPRWDRIAPSGGGSASGLVAPQATSWRRGQLDADNRTMLIRTFDDDGVPSDPTVEWTATIDMGDGVFVEAEGTLTPCSAPLSFENVLIESVDTDDDTLEMTGHSFQTGDGPVAIESADPPAPVTGDDELWIIKVDDDHVRVATSRENALADNYIDLSDAGADPQYIQQTENTKRLIDGHMFYTATQGEASGAGTYRAIRLEAGGHQTSTGIAAIHDETSDVPVIAGYTGAELQRLMVAVIAGPALDFTTNSLVFKCPITNVTRLTVTTGAAGRLSVVIGDLT